MVIGRDGLVCSFLVAFMLVGVNCVLLWLLWLLLGDLVIIDVFCFTLISGELTFNFEFWCYCFLC